MSTKCLTTIPQGSRPQAIGGRNAKGPVTARDIVSSARRLAAATKLAGVGVASTLKIMSADFCVGVPSNILSYYYLLRVAAAWLGFEIGGLSLTFNNTHLYQNHVAQAKAQTENPWTCEPPKLKFAPGEDLGLQGMEDWRALSAHDAIQSLQMEWFSLEGEYRFAGDLKYNVAT